MRARGVAWVLPWAALGCLPRSDDLSAYSEDWSPSGGAPSFGAGGDAAAGAMGGAPTPPTSAGAGGSDGVVGGSTLPLAGGGSSASDVGLDGEGGLAADAGSSGGAGGTASDPSTACADGTLGPDGSECYRVVSTGAFWQDARAQCAAWQGALIKLDNAEEEAFISGLVSASVWLGGSDSVFDNVFVWTDGTPMTYGNWGPNQPDRFPGTDCVEKRDPLTNGLWYDQPCNQALAFVCEKPLATP
jgi:lectin-like protein